MGSTTGGIGLVGGSAGAQSQDQSYLWCSGPNRAWLETALNACKSL